MIKSLELLEEKARKEGISLWEAVREDDCRERQVSPEESFSDMGKMIEAMKAADQSYDSTLSSHSGMAGGNGGKMERARKEGKNLLGPLAALVTEKALKMGESNACMRRIVAAPTAGACGVVPAVFLSLQETKGYTDEELTRAMYVAAGVGSVIAERAFLAGAQGGCQAEIGSASAMAAAGAVCLAGGDGEAMVQAAAMALKNLLGLVCDPVAGLVEVPCVKRNVVGAMNALAAADMALAGIKSVIPPDEVIDAMRSVGLSLPYSLRETGEGGLAATPAGKAVAEELAKEED